MAQECDALTPPAETEALRLISVAREQGRPDSYTGKRRWTRYALGVRLEVTVNPDKLGHTWLARTHNISGGGLGFWSNQQVAKGTEIWLREWSEQPGGTWVPARVTYCTLGIGGYLVGVAFSAPCQPDSLLNNSYVASIDEGMVGHVPVGLLAPCRSMAAQCAFNSALAGAAAVALGTHVAMVFGLNVAWTPLASLILSLVLGAFLGSQMLRRESKFLKVLRTAVAELSAGTPGTIRLPPASSHELNQLRDAVLELGSKWRRQEDAERLQRQRLEELARIKSNILSTVSHDLRTPLTSILLYTRMLTEELDSMPREDQLRFLGIISDECTRLSRLLDDLLEVQRLESGRVEWHMERQDLSSTIRSMAHVFEAMARGNSIEFTVDCSKNLPPLNADADKIAQVISNLLSNAMKYTPAGGKVHLSARARADHILISVSDNGPGIPRDKWDQIFDRFSQLSNPGTREIAGVGLGLYIVREIVQRHGGRVWVDSELGRGSDFYVSLPLEVIPSDPASRRDDASPPRRVVFCDADPELAAVVAQTLRLAGFDVQVVHSAGRLLERLSQGAIDVVVTDVLLPDMTAPDLLDALAGFDRHAFQLVLHSYEDPDLPMSEEVSSIFLRRPASKEELIQTVNLALQKKRAPGGITILMVGGDDGDSEPLRQVLSGRGHACVVVLGMGAAANWLSNHRADLVLVDKRALGLGWANLSLLEHSRDAKDFRLVVLCDAVCRTDRRLADMHGASVVVCTPGAESAAAEAILAPAPLPVAEPQS